jgi:ABC-2 type transport system ATP-binding protein
MADRPAIVRVQGVSKRFVIRKDKSLKERLVNSRRGRAHREDFWALRDVDLDIHAGHTVGLIGPNGSGKSTLLKTIGGIIEPTEGRVLRRGQLAALLELGAGFHPDLTGRENVFLNSAILGLSRQQTEGYFDSIVAFSGIEPFIDTQVKFYSSGMYVRLAFAVAVHVDPDLLLVDEVLAVGDEAFQRKCLDKIKSFQREGRTIVLVTHSLDQVRDICDRAIVLEAGRVVLDGPPIDALRRLRDDFEEQRVAERDEVGATSEAPAVPAARVTEVRMRDLGGAPLLTAAPGDCMIVDVTVQPSGSVEDWSVGFSVETPGDLVLYGTSTALSLVTLPPLDRPRTVRFTVPHLPLNEGQFFVSAAVAGQQGPEYHRSPRAAAFTVRGSGRGVGPVDLAPEVSLLDPGDGR